ncbi:hypothetical protein P389DRAFT_38719 [Cystobasidium minutum MCA 4210]|uniref:uncharacterized protein n=1 Tax=Cystobasidium minutum MCA 4210 TaxID=1397322 RepID=UPI0034CF84CE|eukprot:jgi/Rhomi1/38719/CE38718_2112
MSDSNGSLKRARSTSPANGRASNSQSSTGKKQNTGKPTSSSNESGSARSSSNAARAGGSAGTMNDSNRSARDSSREQAGSSRAEPAASTDAPSSTQQTSTSEQSAAAVDASAPQITIKALIVTQDASIIIGKAGAHIKEIREKAGARVSVSDQIPGNPERILNVTGPLDAVSKAYGLIVRKINDEPFDQPSLPGSRAVTIKYIVPNSRMGSVIGKAGSKIKEIQEASGAKLQASEAMLTGSTERILSVSGVADAVHIAVYYIGTILQEGQDRQQNNIPYRPSAAPGYPPAGSSYAPPSGSRGPPGGSSYYPPGAPAPYGASYGGPPPSVGAPAAAGYHPPAGNPGDQTQSIYIPNDLVGNIIGKGGQKINEIRQMSACNIKITEGTESQGTGARPGERLVTITGAPHNIQTAVQMLHSRLEQERQRKLQQTSGTYQPQGIPGGM